MRDHTMSHSVSVIGLGAMGSAIARTFIAAGYHVSVWNRSRDKIDAMASVGATACNGPKQALNASPRTVVCLTDYAAWNALIADQQLQEAFAGKCIIQLTGGTFDEVQEHAAFIAAQGGRIADGALMCFHLNSAQQMHRCWCPDHLMFSMHVTRSFARLIQPGPTLVTTSRGLRFSAGPLPQGF